MEFSTRLFRLIFVGHCKNDRLLVQFRGNADIEAPLIGTFRFGVFFLAQCQIIIHCTVGNVYIYQL